MSTFVDTSGLLALLDGDAREHPAAAAAWRQLLGDDEPLISTNYVLVETYALVQRRLGMAAVRVLSRDFVPLLEVEWLDEETHNAAVAALLTSGRRQLSLVDCVSFEAMRRRGLTRAFAFDADFVEQGFDVVPAADSDGGSASPEGARGSRRPPLAAARRAARTGLHDGHDNSRTRAVARARDLGLLD